MGGEIGKVYCGNRGLIMILNVFVRAYFLWFLCFENGSDYSLIVYRIFESCLVW